MLDRLDKEPFAMEEIEEATELMEQRLQEQVPIEQECIPAGCLPPASVAIWGGGSAQESVYIEGYA